MTTGAPCTPATRFQAASVSKNFVAASMLLLSDRGALRLHDPVSRWWSPTPPVWKAMTVGHLLRHTAGLTHWGGIPQLDISHPPAAEEILDQVASLPLVSAPGGRWSYSGVGYLLAAAIIETAAGDEYARFVSDNIFKPLEMASTTSGEVPEPGRAATGHRNGRSVPLSAGLTTLPGTGDAWTTVGDLVRYVEGWRKAGPLPLRRQPRLSLSACVAARNRGHLRGARQRRVSGAR